MSYILDALKKAERERHVAKIPTLATVHAPSRDRRRPRWIWLGAAIVVINAALVGTWLLRPGPMAEKPPRSPAPPPAPRQAAIESPPAPPPTIDRPPAAPVAGPAAIVRPPAPPASGPARIERPPAPPEAVAAAPASPAKAASPTKTPLPAPPAQSSASRPSEARTGAPPPPRPAAPEGMVAATPPVAPRVPPPAAPSQAASPPTAASPAPAVAPGTAPSPGIQDLTPAEQQGLPKISLQFLVYSEIPSERLVFINNQKYVEGQSIEGKVVVEGILPDGAILSYQGKRFKLRQ